MVKILLTTKLSDKKLYDKLIPLVESELVSSIEVIRYKPGKKIPKVTYYTLPKLISSNLLIQIFSLFLLIFYRILVNRPDVLIGIYYVPYGFFVQFFGNFFRIPSIINLIGSDINQYSKKRRLWNYIKKFMRKSHLLTTTGEHTKQFLISEGFEKNRIEILPNPVDPTKFYPLNLVKEYDLITVSNLIKRKRIDKILLALVEVKKRFSNVKFAIVGDGEERKNLEKIVYKYNLSNNVQFLGHCSNINELLNKSKIFVLFSEGEGLPVAMLEAMATGLIIITTDVGDINDVIKNGVNGIILPDSEVYTLASEITRLLSDYYDMEGIRKNALIISQTNSPKKVKFKWEYLIKKVM